MVSLMFVITLHRRIEFSSPGMAQGTDAP